MNKLPILSKLKISPSNPLLIAFLFILTGNQIIAQVDYLDYHSKTMIAEEHISREEYDQALATYQKLFTSYDFIFLRDLKIAAQLALQVNDTSYAFDLISEGVTNGWHRKALKKNSFIKPLQKHQSWKDLEQNYEQLYSLYEQRIDQDLRDQVQAMFKKDQKKAMGALLRVGNKAQEKYGTEKFGPHSENQMKELIGILQRNGYPGEKLIGNNYWMSTIISHHNSVSRDYVTQDTIYASIRPELVRAIQKGEMSPYEFALIEDWRKAVIKDDSQAGYGYLTQVKKASLQETNALRQSIGLRSVALRNQLIAIEQKTGMNLYLPDWVDGEITIEP